MEWPAAKELLSTVIGDKFKASAMAPLQWIVAIVFAGTAALATATGTNPWVIGPMVAMIIVLVGFFCFAYWQHMKHNPDALRSERFSLHKMEIERGLSGDDKAGLADRPIILQPPIQVDNATRKLPPSEASKK